MDGIRQYLLSIVTAALICAVVQRFSEKASQSGAIIQIVCGIILAITVVSPWFHLQLPDVDAVTEPYASSAEQIILEGEESASESMNAIIKSQMEAYILDKANSLDMEILVEVNLDAQNHLPKSVTITGDASPYDKSVLSQYIAQTLDIPEEDQKWE